MANDIYGALFNTIIGMGTVFLVLIFISLIISLFVFVPGFERRWSRFWTRFKESFSRKMPEHGIEEDPERLPKRPILTPEELGYEEEVSADDALIAVIMAAILASEGGAVSADRLVVRSIRKLKRRTY